MEQVDASLRQPEVAPDPTAALVLITRMNIHVCLPIELRARTRALMAGSYRSNCLLKFAPVVAKQDVPESPKVPTEGIISRRHIWR